MTVQAIEAIGLDQFDAIFKDLGDKADKAARMAINDTAVFARRIGAEEIASRVNFTKQYLTGGAHPRLAISRRATDANLEAVVTGRDRPTSLARFTSRSPSFGRQGSSPPLQVARKGSSAPVKGSFFVKLRAGSADSGQFNVGLAVRLKPGERIPGKTKMAPTKSGLYLLYGPSVGQLYRTVSVESEPQVANHLVDEFVRQIERTL